MAITSPTTCPCLPRIAHRHWPTVGPTAASENEFESIIIELNNKKHNRIVREIYRIPNTIYWKIWINYKKDLHTHKGDIIIGTDPNFNLLNICHNNTIQLLNTFITAGYIPTITKPTWIKYTVQITFIFIDFRVCDFAFGFKTQNAPCVSRFKCILFSDRFQFAF